MGRSVSFAAADWTDEERRIAIAQNSRLCGMPDENCLTEAPNKSSTCSSSAALIEAFARK
jgi:hypothetical protein